jgi:hypothetical protein
MPVSVYFFLSRVQIFCARKSRRRSDPVSFPAHEPSALAGLLSCVFHSLLHRTLVSVAGTCSPPETEFAFLLWSIFRFRRRVCFHFLLVKSVPTACALQRRYLPPAAASSSPLQVPVAPRRICCPGLGPARSHSLTGLGFFSRSPRLSLCVPGLRDSNFLERLIPPSLEFSYHRRSSMWLLLAPRRRSPSSNKLTAHCPCS